MKNAVPTPSATLPAHRAQAAQFAQVAWSLIVAGVIAFVVVQHTMGSRRSVASVMPVESSAPKTLVTGQPVPLSQEDLNAGSDARQ